MNTSVDSSPKNGVAVPRTFSVRNASRSSRWIVAGLIVASTILFFVLASDDWFSIVNFTLITAIAALGLNVLSGYTGQVSLGIVFFMSIGAYTAALLGGSPDPVHPALLGYNLSFLIWLPAAGIVAALAGALIGPTALRLKGFYLGIVSLSLVFIGQYVFQNASRITGGPQGRDFPAPNFGDATTAINQQNTFLGMALTAGQQYFLLILLVLVLAAFFVHNVMRSRAGRAFQAVRDNETGAAIMGVNLFEAKMGAFILSSFLAGIAGALYASYIGRFGPNDWTLTLSIQFVAAIIIGGIASVWGSILGAAFVFGLPLVINQFSLLPQSSGGLQSGDLNALIYGALIIVFLLFEPGGLIGLVRRGLALSRRFRSQEGGDPAEITDLPDNVAVRHVAGDLSSPPEENI